MKLTTRGRARRLARSAKSRGVRPDVVASRGRATATVSRSVNLKRHERVITSAQARNLLVEVERTSTGATRTYSTPLARSYVRHRPAYRDIPMANGTRHKPRLLVDDDGRILDGKALGWAQPAPTAQAPAVLADHVGEYQGCA